MNRIAIALLIGPCLGTAQAQVPANPYNYSRTTSFTYDAAGRVSSQTAEPGNAPSCVVTSYAYDAYGNRTSSTTANCPNATGGAVFPSRTSTASYTAPASQTITVSDNNNVASSVAISYPSGLFPTTVTNALGQSETRQFDPRFGTMTRLTGPNGLETTWAYDDFGRKIKETAPDGTSGVFFYCLLASSGLNTSSNTPGCPTPISGEAPADAITFVHSEPRDRNNAKMGAFTRVYTDRLGRTIRTATESFDGSGQPGARSGALIVQDTVYNVYGAKVIETQPYFLASGASTTTGANSVGATLVSYDVLGRPTTVYTSDPNGQAGSRTYGAYGTRVSAKTTYAYSGLTVSVTNDKGQTRTEETNAIGELVRVSDASGAQLAHQRDAFGNLVATKDALQNTITMGYDVAGRKIRMSDPDAGVWGYCYDALGQLTAQQNTTMRDSFSLGACPSNPNSGSAANAIEDWTTFGYDKLGRTTQRIEPEFTSTWSYDQYADGSACNKGRGKLCQVVTSHGLNRKVVYDSLGRAINSLTTTGTGPSFASAVAYDATSGRVASQTYPSGLQVGYAYTGRGFLEKLSLLTPASVQPLPAVNGSRAPSASLAAGTVLWQAQTVNAWNATERQSYSNGVVGTTGFEEATGRAIDIGAGQGPGNGVLNHHYTWDSLNNLVARSDANGDGGSGAVTEVFTYGDKLNRLTGYSVAAPAIPGFVRNVSLQYNALGMLLYKSDVGAYQYGRQGPGAIRPHALLGVSGATVTSNGYDANGNLTSASAGKYRDIGYTSFNLPDSQGGISAAGATPRYTWVYDESHARIKEVRTGMGATGTRTTWYMHPDNQGGLGFEREDNSNAGSGNRHFLSAGGQAIGVLVSTGALPVIAAGQTAPPALQSVTLAKVEYWHKDHLGSLAATTNHVGNVTARYAYDPFGKRRFTNGRYDAFGNVIVDWSPAVSEGTPRGFTGHEGLDEVGLVHMNGRIFDSTLGVFLQADPHITDAGNLQNYHRYGYCLSNPLSCTDPSGFDDGLAINLLDGGGAGGSFGSSNAVQVWPTVTVTGCRVAGCSQSTINLASPAVTLTQKVAAREAGTGGGGVSARAALIPATAANSPGATGVKYTAPQVTQASSGFATFAHGALGIASLCPFACGSVASFADGLLYTAQGDKLGAGISFGAALAGLVTDAGMAKAAAAGAKGLAEASTAAKSAAPYAGMKEASLHLQEIGVPRAQRVQILQSFKAGTLNLRAAGSSEYGLRFFDGVNAQASGRYLFETFPASRESLALSGQWNQMTGVAQWQIRPGAMLIEGRAAGQGVGLPGGQVQKFVPNLGDLLRP